MKALGRHESSGAVIAAGLAYLVIGVATAALSKSASSSALTTVWRLAAWLLSLVVFASHLAYERLRVRHPTLTAARLVAIAVALGALALAAAGPVRTHWSAADLRRTAVLSLVLWPVITGIPAFLAALVAGSVLGRVSGRRR